MSKKRTEKSDIPIPEKSAFSGNGAGTMPTPAGVQAGMMSLVRWPGWWLKNIITLQEKKNYDFRVILLFACFVAIMRFLLEVLLAHRILIALNLSLLNFVIFYLHCFFIYTVILKIFIPSQPWRKLINIVLIGIFLGMFPPLIDVLIYGWGNFGYNYVINFPEGWRFFLYHKEVGLIAGEAITIWLTIIFTSLVIFIKTGRAWKGLLGLGVAYLSVLFYGEVIPTLAFKLSESFQFELGNLQKVSDTLAQGLAPYLQYGLSFSFVLSLMELGLCLILYGILNPAIFWQLAKRLNHILPVLFTTLLGYVIHDQIGGYALFIAGCMFFAALVSLVHNDYFDRAEDDISGRRAYLDSNDLNFFNGLLVLLILLFIMNANIVGYCVLLFFVLSCLYHCDFYRGKRWFPANIKIEACAGLAAFLGGILAAFLYKTGLGGDFFHLVNVPSALAGSKEVMATFLQPSDLLFIFLVFGGWSLFAVLKDSKDIERDQAVGNQTLYTLLARRHRNVDRFHAWLGVALFIGLLLPIAWMIVLHVRIPLILLMFLLDLIFLLAITLETSAKSFTRGLTVLNIYLLLLVGCLQLQYFFQR